MKKKNTIADLAKRVGSQTLTSDSVLCKVDRWISTGCIAIDQMLEGGVSGKPIIPYGRITEIAGLQGTGKTTLASQIFAEAQMNDDAICILADTEQAYDLEYAEKLGVNLEDVLYIEASHLEDLFVRLHSTLDVILDMGSDQPIVIVWDSLGQTQTRAEKETKIDAKKGGYKTPRMMTAASAMSTEIRRINGRLAETQTAFVILNQMYSKPTMYGDPWTSYGGQRLKFASSVRLRNKALGKIEEGDEVIGQWVRISCIKSKISPASFKSVEVPLLHNEGFSDDYLIFSRITELDAISKRGGWYTWDVEDGEEVKFQGWYGFQEKVMDHERYLELVDEFFDIVRVEEDDEEE